jgi:hypothetical protein
MVGASLPILTWLAAALLIRGASGRARSLRESLLAAAVLAGGWLVLGTELLSAFGAIRFVPVVLWWALPAVVLLALLLRQRRLPLGPESRWLPSRGQLLLLGPLGFLLGWSLCQAVFAPPNNLDSLSYHLPRQVQWLQQASVENYPTSSLRQIAMPPLTEFAGLHLMVLTGTDRWHNVVQWTAFALTLVAVSLITRRLGGTPSAELLSMLWVATLPMAFVQASNTKNDDVVALWTCVLLLFVLELELEPELRWSRVLLIGLAFGLLVLTKGTGMLFGLPVAVLMAVLLLRRHRRRAAGAVLLVSLVALATNGCAFWRNVQAFGEPIPVDPAIHGGDTVVNEVVSIPAVLSNVLRNVAPHLATPSPELNARLTELVLRVHGWLGIDAADPRTTWHESGFHPYAFRQGNEDAAAAPVHFLLLLLLLVACLLRRPAPDAPSLMLWVSLLAAFLLFCTALKWQLWHVRLVVALAAWPAPLVAIAFTARPLKRLAPVAVLALVVGLLPSLNVEQRPLLGPASILANDVDAIRFYPETDRGRTMAKQAERMSELEPRVVGIASGWSSPDYLLQRALLDRLSPAPTFTAFNATLQVPGKPEPDPDVLLVAGAGPERLRHDSTGTWYVRTEYLRPYQLFLKSAAGDVAPAP